MTILYSHQLNWPNAHERNITDLAPEMLNGIIGRQIKNVYLISPRTEVDSCRNSGTINPCIFSYYTVRRFLCAFLRAVNAYMISIPGKKACVLSTGFPGWILDSRRIWIGLHIVHRDDLPWLYSNYGCLLNSSFGKRVALQLVVEQSYWRSLCAV